MFPTATATATGDSVDHSDHSDNTSDHGSSSKSSGTNKGDPASSSEGDSGMEFVKSENARVDMWRLVVLMVLLATGVMVTMGTYLFLKHKENEGYLESYGLYTNTVSEVSRNNFENFQLTMRGMADQVTVSGLESDSFPLARVPQFEVAAFQARAHSGVQVVGWAPIIVDSKSRVKWTAFASDQANGPDGWLEESQKYIRSHPGAGYANQAQHQEDQQDDTNSTINAVIWGFNEDGMYQEDPDQAPFLPVWQVSPPPHSPDIVNYELLSEYTVARLFIWLLKNRVGIFGAISPTVARLAGVELSQGGVEHPHSLHLQPIFESFNVDAPMVGVVFSIVRWDNYLDYAVPDGVHGITAVLKNTCGDTHTYILQGSDAQYIGPSDMHDPTYDDTEVIVPLTNDISESSVFCVYSFHLYSSDEFKESDTTDLPAICAGLVAGIFLLVGFTFYVYDRFVSRRNSKVVEAATRTNKIVSSLFPTQFRDRLFEETGQQSNKGPRNLKSMMRTGDYLNQANEGDDDDFMYKSKPIADLFPAATICFADIVGFTAWSSVRDPSQVFTLLETLYRAFDSQAKKRGVFKVETIGDCYVAVVGVPEAQKDHAVIMCRFARECMVKMHSISKRLEVTLGPDTGDLGMRVGIHSGPVTAGVLRGERSRFQLFGDTMNTAARMEHTGCRDKIQISQATADLLSAAGKSKWASPREDLVVPKGKGAMQTCWLSLSARSSDRASSIDDKLSSAGSCSVDDENECIGEAVNGHDTKTQRLVEWNTDVLLQLLKQIVARRKACPPNVSKTTAPNEARFVSEEGSHTLGEVLEICQLPRFEKAAVKKQEDPDSIVLDPKVVQQLHDYVGAIGFIYRDNPFHNFEHASHVVMSVVKLLSRIVAPQDLDVDENVASDIRASSLHDHTYGITSCPLTQFACVFSALIHDADHSGLPNAQLVKEGTEMAQYYKNKSVAEQNSVDLTWKLLMSDEYSLLRSTIYQTDEELKRFRQLVVNAVMATDIVDKDLKNIRNRSWDRAFSENKPDADPHDTVSRKATIVIEHLIQASDVSHTMQHWHIYTKWNERLFEEMYCAFLDGQAKTDPSDSWYRGEIGFFDFYIIPLAKKLKSCGVFGVSSDEYLNFAEQNRQEWEQRGKEVVAKMIERAHKKFERKIGGDDIEI